MPHVIIKLWPGNTMDEKKTLADIITDSIHETLGIRKKAVTVAFDDVEPEDWWEKVHVPLIDGNKTGIVFKPEGYKGYKHKKAD